MTKSLSALRARMTPKERDWSDQIYADLSTNPCRSHGCTAPESAARPAKPAKPRAAGRRPLKRA